MRACVPEPGQVRVRVLEAKRAACRVQIMQAGGWLPGGGGGRFTNVCHRRFAALGGV